MAYTSACTDATATLAPLLSGGTRVCHWQSAQTLWPDTRRLYESILVAYTASGLLFRLTWLYYWTRKLTDGDQSRIYSGFMTVPPVQSQICSVLTTYIDFLSQYIEFFLFSYRVSNSMYWVIKSICRFLNSKYRVVNWIYRVVNPIYWVKKIRKIMQMSVLGLSLFYCYYLIITNDILHVTIVEPLVMKLYFHVYQRWWWFSTFMGCFKVL